MSGPATKAAVFAWAADNGVEITHETPSVMSPVHHVHADIVSGRRVFLYHELHNLGLWDACQAPDWREIGKALIEADIGPCPRSDCPVCEAP